MTSPSATQDRYPYQNEPIRSASCSCAWRFGSSRACVYPSIVVLNEACRRSSCTTFASTPKCQDTTGGLEMSVFTLCCRDRLRRCGTSFTTADTLFVFRVRHQDAVSWGPSAGTFRLAHVAVEQRKHAD